MPACQFGKHACAWTICQNADVRIPLQYLLRQISAADAPHITRHVGVPLRVRHVQIPVRDAELFRRSALDLNEREKLWIEVSRVLVSEWIRWVRWVSDIRAQRVQLLRAPVPAPKTAGQSA